MDFGLSIVGYSKTGLIPIISTKLPFLNSSESPSLDTFLYRFSTPLGMILGQGDQYYTGLYGPYPVPNFNQYHAYTFSFFLTDTILGTPRDDLNAFLIAIVFVRKEFIIDMPYIDDFLTNYVKLFTNLNDLISKTNFEIFVEKLSSNIFESISKEIKVPQEMVVENFNSHSVTQTKVNPVEVKVKDKEKENPVFIELKTEPESIIAVPWILHAVYHGLEQATIDILGESSSLLEILMEQYTGEILDRFHLFDAIFEKENPTVADALELGVKHLERLENMYQ